MILTDYSLYREERLQTLRSNTTVYYQQETEWQRQHCLNRCAQNSQNYRQQARITQNQQCLTKQEYLRT